MCQKEHNMVQTLDEAIDLISKLVCSYGTPNHQEAFFILLENIDSALPLLKYGFIRRRKTDDHE